MPSLIKGVVEQIQWPPSAMQLRARTLSERRLANTTLPSLVIMVVELAERPLLTELRAFVVENKHIGGHFPRDRHTRPTLTRAFLVFAESLHNIAIDAIADGDAAALKAPAVELFFGELNEITLELFGINIMHVLRGHGLQSQIATFDDLTGILAANRPIEESLVGVAVEEVMQELYGRIG